MGEMNKIIFCAGGSDRAILWLDYAIKSIRKFTGNNIEIYVASDRKIQVDGAKVIDANPLIKRMGLDRIMSFRYHRGNCNPMILFRLAIPLLDEFKDDDKVLYIDADTEVIDSRFLSIFDYEFDYDILACNDYDDFSRRKMTKFMFDRDIVKCMRKNAKERMRRGLYANSGVMMFNLEHIRKLRPDYEKEMQTMLQLMVDKHLFWDQDIINIYFSIDFMGREYNYFPKSFKKGDKPYLLHYVASAKLEGNYPPPSERDPVIKVLDYEKERA